MVFSEGTWDILGPPLTDGWDAFAWMAAQPWSNGKVSTLGCSSHRAGCVIRVLDARSTPPAPNLDHAMIRPSLRLLALVAATVLATACGEERRVALGPVDGTELPPADTGRVAVGDVAPDFALASYDGGVVRLSDFRGKKDVILVFYRGYW